MHKVIRPRNARWARGSTPGAGFLLLLGCLLQGCTPGLEVVTDCRSQPGIGVQCGFQNPEDLALLADGRTVIVSQMGAMDGSRAGNIAVLDVPTAALRIAFPAEPNGWAAPSESTAWGDPDCSRPPQPLSPHGIDVRHRADGKLELFVVNHGQRESIEFFEILGSGDSTAIDWRGCSIPPEGTFFNDIVGLPDGGFLATHMLERDAMAWNLLRAMMALDTGFVYEWHPSQPYRVVPGTAGAFPNGIELSEDDSEIILNLYFGDEVRRVSRESGETLASASIAKPDNVTWDRRGRLLVASHPGASLRNSMLCSELEEGACPFAFEIWSVDPVTLSGEVEFANEGTPMGAGTVALEVGDELLIGSFAGDRIIRVPRAGER